MSLITEYKNKVKNNLLINDPIQFDIILKLDKLKAEVERNYSWLRFFWRCLLASNTMPQGIYLYSDVGRGKTMLMDLFYNNLHINPESRLRVHFHLFMRTMHKCLQSVSGRSDPIDYIIKYNFKKYKIICLDEFIVTDIADAVILARILKSLIKYKIILITTSNSHPDDLYKHGLQRGLFLPAIQLLKENLEVINLPGLIDYRAKMLEQMSCYYWPNNQDNLNILKNIFSKLTQAFCSDANGKIIILDRPIEYIAISNNQNIVWFDFNIVCNTARSQADYLEIASIYQTILISNIYNLADDKLDIVRRFINLIDILYDFKVNLIICADCELDYLYTGSVLNFEFARVISRLKEMQTAQYLDAGHLG